MTELRKLLADRPTGFKLQQDFDPVKALELYRVDPTRPIEKPIVVLRISEAPVATIGNCSLIIGPAKSKKTFAVTAFAAAACGYSTIEVINCEQKGLKVILIDTEQSTYHLHRMVDRIIRQVGNGIPENFEAYGLRPLAPQQRVEMVETIISGLIQPALVIIDGLRDLLSRGITDDGEGPQIMSKILRWTYEKPCHIMLVLHQNKNDRNARGHVGTEAVNKSETVLSVQRDDKNRDISVVTAEYCRDIDFEPFAFLIGEDGLPYRTDLSEGTQTRKTAEMVDNFRMILSGLRSMTYSELVQSYVEVSGAADRTAKRHIAAAIKSKVLRKGQDDLYRIKSGLNEDEEPPF